MNVLKELDRIPPILLCRRMDDRARQYALDQLEEMRRWILAYGDEPRLTWNGKLQENAAALRLHAYRCVIAAEDGLEPPPSPTAAPPRNGFNRSRLGPRPIVRSDEDYSQEYWSEGGAL